MTGINEDRNHANARGQQSFIVLDWYGFAKIVWVLLGSGQIGLARLGRYWDWVRFVFLIRCSDSPCIQTVEFVGVCLHLFVFAHVARVAVPISCDLSNCEISDTPLHHITPGIYHIF